MDLPTAGFNSQGMGMQVKTSKENKKVSGDQGDD